MEPEILQKANELDEKINEIKRSLDSFEWDYDLSHPVSRNPKIIIECDDGDDGREKNMVPIILQPKMAEFLKDFIKTELAAAEKELKEL